MEEKYTDNKSLESLTSRARRILEDNRPSLELRQELRVAGCAVYSEPTTNPYHSEKDPTRYL